MQYVTRGGLGQAEGGVSRQGVGNHGGPPELLFKEGQGADAARMTCKAGGVCPLGSGLQQGQEGS